MSRRHIQNFKHLHELVENVLPAGAVTVYDEMDESFTLQWNWSNSEESGPDAFLQENVPAVWIKHDCCQPHQEIYPMDKMDFMLWHCD